LQHEIDHLDGILFTDRVEDKETIKFVGTDDDDRDL
jgi:peptide deformylase